MPVMYLIADQESAKAAEDFCALENKDGRFTYHYDCSELAVGEMPADTDLQRFGLHFIYKPQLTPEEIIEETWKNAYFGVRVRPKFVHPDVQSYCDQRIGTSLDNFTQRMLDKQELGHWYMLMNTPGQNTLTTAEWTQRALLDAWAPTDFARASRDVASGLWISTNMEQECPHTASTAEIKGKTVAVIGMGNNGQEMARRLKAQHVKVVCWGQRRAQGGYSFSAQDAKILGVEWARSIEDAVRQADAVCIHTPGVAENVLRGEHLSVMKKPKVVIVNAARADSVNKAALRATLLTRREKNQELLYYEDNDIFRSEQGSEESESVQLEGPLLPTVQLYEEFPESIRCTPNWCSTADTDYRAAMQGFRQLSNFIWYREVWNAIVPPPEGFRYMGNSLPPAIGPVSTAMINEATQDTAELLDTVKRLGALLESREGGIRWDRDQAQSYHGYLHKLVNAHTARGASLLHRVSR